MTIPLLPNEVYVCIFEQLTEYPETLASASLCSHFFHAIVTPVLYRTLRLDRFRYLRTHPLTYSEKDQILSCFTTLLTNDDAIAENVRCLKISGTSISKERERYPGSSVPAEIQRDRLARRVYASKWEKSGVWERIGLKYTEAEDGNTLFVEESDDEDVLTVYDGVKGRQRFRSDYNKVLGAVLEKCGRLKEFSIKGALELETSTIASMSSLPLERVSIAFADSMTGFWDPGERFYYEETRKSESNVLYPTPGYTDISLSPLSNLRGTLTSLKLLELTCDVWKFVDEIADILIACRNTLVELGLQVYFPKRSWLQSMPAAFIYDESEKGYEPSAEVAIGDTWFWMKICCRYARRTRRLQGDNRLKLKKLQLWHGCSMFHKGMDPFADEVGEYLSDALDLKYLENLSWRLMDRPGDDVAATSAGWGRLDPAVNLKYVGFEDLTDPLRRFLSDRQGKLEGVHLWGHLNWFDAVNLEEHLKDSYNAIFSESLKSFKCSPIGRSNLELLVNTSQNLESVTTRVFDMPWREAFDTFSRLPKIRKLRFELSLEVDDTYPGNPGSIKLAERITDGLNTFNIIERWKDYLSQGKWKYMELLKLDADNVDTGMWKLRTQATGYGGNWEEYQTGKWVAVNLDDPQAHVKRPGRRQAYS